MKIHSEVNLITNSSSELFVVLNSIGPSDDHRVEIPKFIDQLKEKLDNETIMYKDSYKKQVLDDVSAAAFEYMKKLVENNVDNLDYEDDEAFLSNSEYHTLYNGPHANTLQTLGLAEKVEIYS